MTLTTSHSLLPDEDKFWVEECARYSCGDCDQVTLASEDFDLTGAGELGEIDGAPVTDAGGGEFVGSDAGHVWE